MLNEDKIKVMNRLAIYEKTEGRKYLPVSKYYRSDYIGLALIRNFFLVTAGYLLVLACLGVYYADYLMENIHRMDLMQTARYVIGGYIGALVVFSVLTYILYSVKYHIAKKSVRGYYQNLTKLEKMYNREEKSNSSHHTAGGSGE